MTLRGAMVSPAIIDKKSGPATALNGEPGVKANVLLNSQSRVQDRRPESSQATNISLAVEVGDGSGIPPEAEAKAIFDGVSTEHHHKREDKETEHKEDLACGH